MMNLASVRAAAAVLCVSMLGACSSVELLYSFADDVVESRARSLLDISTDADDIHLEETVDRFFANQAKDWTPKIGDFLELQAQALEAGGGATDQAAFRATVQEFRALLREIARDASPSVASVLIRHTTESRIDHFEAELARVRAESRAKSEGQSREDYRDERIEKVTEGIERFIPDLTDAQVELIAVHVDAELDRGSRTRWLLNGERKHAALIAFLRSGPEEAEIADYMTYWMSEPWRLVDPDYREIADAWWMTKADLFWQISQTLSDTQRREAVTILRGYAVDVAGLAG